MIQATESFKTNDGLSIHTVSWIPDELQGIVILVHGYGEHIGRYQYVAETLAQNGYAVFGLDHRGHGKSEGLSAYFETFDQPIADLKHYVDTIQTKHPDTKIFMLGHSMGSLIGLGFALQHQAQIAGLILSGTAVTGFDSQPGFLMQTVKGLAKLTPKLPLVPALSVDLLSRDEAVIQAYNDDPLVYQGLWRVGMLRAFLQINEQIKNQISQLKLPILVIHGAEDELTPPSGADLIYTRASSTDKQLKKYPNLRHEILNEPERDEVLADIVAWLSEH